MNIDICRKPNFFTFVALNFTWGTGTMKRSEKYMINFGSLNQGIHEFMFEINDDFFEQFENSLVHRVKAKILVTLKKEDNMLILDFTIDGIAILPCDRCLEELNVEIGGTNELIVKFGEHTEEESEDVIMLPNKAHQLDVSHFIYEYVSMLIPLCNIHPDDGVGNSLCNPEALKEIERYKIQKEQNSADPRWGVLKNINPN